MNFKILLASLSFLIFASTAAADEMSTLGRLSDIVDSQCRRFYGIDSQGSIEELKRKNMSEVDKLACAYPFAFHKVQSRLKILEELDPQSRWGKQAYLTLASRIYNFDYLTSSPHPGGPKTEILAVHPDLLILHRILRQTTPYALAFAYPHLDGRDADIPEAARRAAAGVAELTPWSATLRVAKGTDCYGPAQDSCLKNRATAFQDLLQATQLLAKNENLNGYVSNYSDTREATELQSAPLIRMTTDIKKSISGESVDYILGVPTSADWLIVRPDLRDILDYLSASDQDLQSPANNVINLDKLNCKVVFSSLMALAYEDGSNPIRQAILPFNPMETIIARDPKLRDDGLRTQALLDQQNCEQLHALSSELNLRGLLSRFQAYQTHVILLSSHDDALSDASLKAGSRRFALMSDIEHVITEVHVKAIAAGLTPKPITSPNPQQLVDYVSNLLKEDNP